MRNLELALSHLEALSAARIDEVITLTQKEIASIRAEKDSLQNTLCTAQTDLALTEQLKRQVSEYQAMEELCNTTVQKLEARVAMLTETQRIHEENLQRSRQREDELQRALAARGSAADSSGSVTDNAGEPSRAELLRQLQAAQTRVTDLETELKNASSNINDLILEIETVSSEEAKARTQGARLLKQIAETQALQRVALEENLHLHNQIEAGKESQKDAETK